MERSNAAKPRLEPEHGGGLGGPAGGRLHEPADLSRLSRAEAGPAHPPAAGLGGPARRRPMRSRGGAREGGGGGGAPCDRPPGVTAAPHVCSPAPVPLRGAVHAASVVALPGGSLVRDGARAPGEPARQGHAVHPHRGGSLPRVAPRRPRGPHGRRGRGHPGGPVQQLLRRGPRRAPHGGRAGAGGRHPRDRAGTRLRAAAGRADTRAHRRPGRPQRVLPHQRLARRPGRGADRRPTDRERSAGADLARRLSELGEHEAEDLG
jgi:hypothetical protein